MPLSIPFILRPLLNQPVAVLGSGRTGRAVLGLLHRMGATGTLFDEKDVKNAIVNNFTREAARANRLVIFSPSFPVDHAWLQLAREEGCACLGELDFASLLWRGQTLAVTGTHGKNQLAEFLAHALQTVGTDGRVGGGIGSSFCQLVLDADGGRADTTAICAVTSFEAATLRHFRADALLWTNFAENQYEQYSDSQNYFAAKWALVSRTSTKAVFVGASVSAYAKRSGLALPASFAPFSEVKSADAAYRDLRFLRSLDEENYSLAAAWWQHAGLAETLLDAAVRTFVARRSTVAVSAPREREQREITAMPTFGSTPPLIPTFSFAPRETERESDAFAASKNDRGSRSKKSFLAEETGEVLESFCRAYRLPSAVFLNYPEMVMQRADAATDGALLSPRPGFGQLFRFPCASAAANQVHSIVNNLGATATLG